MKFYDQLYVGFQSQRFGPNDPGRMLGFATYVEKNSAFEKRKDTVDRWASKEIPPKTYDNKPLSGFKIIETHSRYSTDNKVFRIEDPRGFELEIYADNLMDVILNNTVVNGLIVGNMLWGRIDGKNYLASENSKEYKEFKAGPIAFDKETQIYFKNKTGNTIYKYLGKFWYNQIDCEEIYERNSSYYYRNNVKPTDYNVTVRRPKEKVSVYAEFVMKGDGEIVNYPGKKDTVYLRKSEFQDLIPVKEEEITNRKIKDFKLDFSQDFNKLYSVLTLMGAYDSKFYLFNSKEECVSSKTYDPKDIISIYQSPYRSVRNVTFNDKDYKAK